MTDRPTRIQLRCPRCGKCIGTLSYGIRLDATVFCPRCGFTFGSPTMLERITGVLTRLRDRGRGS